VSISSVMNKRYEPGRLIHLSKYPTSEKGRAFGRRYYDRASTLESRLFGSIAPFLPQALEGVFL